MTSDARGPGFEGPVIPPRYRWTCPICGSSRSRLITDGVTDRHVTNDLTSHVRTSNGGGHGPNGSLPDGWSGEDLATHVDRKEV